MTEDTRNIRPVLDPRWLQPARVNKATAITSVAILAALLFAMLHPDSMPHNQEAFGDIATHLGLPLWGCVTSIVCLVYLPIPYALWHLFRIVFRAASEGATISKFGIVRAVFTVPSRHPDLKALRLIVLSILGGYIVAAFTYAFLADENDLNGSALKSRRVRRRIQPSRTLRAPLSRQCVSRLEYDPTARATATQSKNIDR